MAQRRNGTERAHLLPGEPAYGGFYGAGPALCYQALGDSDLFLNQGRWSFIALPASLRPLTSSHCSVPAVLWLLVVLVWCCFVALAVPEFTV